MGKRMNTEDELKHLKSQLTILESKNKSLKGKEKELEVENNRYRRNIEMTINTLDAVGFAPATAERLKQTLSPTPSHSDKGERAGKEN